MAKEFIYKVIRADCEGNRIGTRSKRLYRWEGLEGKLEVGHTYLHLGPGYPGFHKVLELEEVREYPD